MDYREHFLYEHISKILGVLPFPNPIWPHDLVAEDCKKASSNEELLLKRFPIVTLTSNGNSHPIFETNVTGTCLEYHAEKEKQPYDDLPGGLCGQFHYPNENDLDAKKASRIYDFDLSNAMALGVTAQGVTGKFGSNSYKKKYVRVSNLKKYVFQRSQNDKEWINDLVGLVAASIARSTGVSDASDCIVIGVITAAYIGRLEILGVKSSSSEVTVSVVTEGLSCSAASHLTQKNDFGDDGLMVIGAKMECFLLMKEYERIGTDT